MDPSLTLAALRAAAPGFAPRVAVVLGSGWGAMADRLHDAHRIPYDDLPGFPRTGVAGHGGTLVCGRAGTNAVALMSGRSHAYETGEPTGMRTPLRALRAWGAEVLVLTNAAGSLNAGMPPGSLMVLGDHLNIAQRSPLVGEGGSERFVDMSAAYDAGLRALAQACAGRLGRPLHEGVYAWVLGPQFETPAEIRMLRTLGADAVGMSTVPDTIIGRHAGMRVLALSLMTNMAAGLSAERLSHAHTLAQAQAAAEGACALLAEVLAAI